MEGDPAWMASVSLRGPRGVVNVGSYTMEQMLRAKSILNQALRGAGDPRRERLFRTNLCLFLHRTTSADERARLPQVCAAHPACLPVSILYTRGLPPIPSTDPCANPVRELLVPGRPDLWTPLECGDCESCRARDALRSRA